MSLQKWIRATDYAWDLGSDWSFIAFIFSNCNTCSFDVTTYKRQPLSLCLPTCSSCLVLISTFGPFNWLFGTNSFISSDMVDFFKWPSPFPTFSTSVSLLFTSLYGPWHFRFNLKPTPHWSQQVRLLRTAFHSFSLRYHFTLFVQLLL